MIDWPILNPSNYYFNHHAVAPAFVALAVFCAGLYVFLKEEKLLPNISFFTFCITISIWLSGMALLYSTQNPIVADIIFRYYVFFGVALMPPVFFLLTASILRLPEKRLFILINFIIAITFYIFDIKTNYLYLEMQNFSYGYYPFTNYGIYLFLLFFYVTVLICFKNYFKNIKNIKFKIEKNRIKDLAIGFLIAYTAGIDYLPALDINIYPYGYIFVIIGMTYVFHAKPWLGIKNGLLKEGAKENIFIDNNINKNPTNYSFQVFK